MAGVIAIAGAISIRAPVGLWTLALLAMAGVGAAVALAVISHDGSMIVPVPVQILALLFLGRSQCVRCGSFNVRVSYGDAYETGVDTRRSRTETCRECGHARTFCVVATSFRPNRERHR